MPAFILLVAFVSRFRALYRTRSAELMLFHFFSFWFNSHREYLSRHHTSTLRCLFVGNSREDYCFLVSSHWLMLPVPKMARSFFIIPSACTAAFGNDRRVFMWWGRGKCLVTAKGSIPDITIAAARRHPYRANFVAEPLLFCVLFHLWIIIAFLAFGDCIDAFGVYPGQLRLLDAPRATRIVT